MGPNFWTVLGRICLQPDFREALRARTDPTATLMADVPALCEYLCYPHSANLDHPLPNPEPQPRTTFLLQREEVMEVNVVLRSLTLQGGPGGVRVLPELGEPGGLFDQIASAWATSATGGIGGPALWQVMGLAAMDGDFRDSLVANGGSVVGLRIIFPDNATPPPPGPLLSPKDAPVELVGGLSSQERADLQTFLADPDNVDLLARVSAEAWDEHNRCPQGYVLANYEHSRAPER